jgi:hypothetical protein
MPLLYLCLQYSASLGIQVNANAVPQRLAQELISVSNLATRAHLLSFNRIQSRVVIGPLTGCNTLRRHLYVMGLGYNPTCRKCGTEAETSVTHFV